jgi:hypothetical protein
VAVSGQPDPPDALTRATELLRQHTDAGWTVMSPQILHRAMSAFRPSAPVRGRHGLGEYTVTSDIVVAQVRAAVETVPAAVVVRDISCRTGEQDELAGVTVQIVAPHGSRLVALADQLHAVIGLVLTDLLGPLAPAGDLIETHVHLADVSDPSHPG